MPAKAFLWVVCLLTLFTPLSSPGKDGDQTLRPVLERAYNQWRQAMIAQDARAWAASITQYRQVVTRNLIVSQRKAFPASVFQVPVEPPPVDGLRLLEAQGVGSTAHLLYFGKVNAGGDPALIPDSILMLKFFKEDTGWKFDSSKLMKLQEQPQLLAELKKGGAPDFLDRPEFTPPGKAPTVPAICKSPENVAACTIQSFGYETRMTINGFSYPVMADQAEKALVIGGLDNGTNELVLTVKPTNIPKGEKRLLQVDLFLAPSKDGASGLRVFHYENTAGDLGGTLKMPIIIDADTLKKGR
jgi:hypothetical protein